jgi:FAD-dependent urate hydroxylase
MTQALIIGGGIAGSVAAMALQQIGMQAVVYEAYPESSGAGVGAWLTMAVNGLSALRTLDLHRTVMSRGFPSANIELVSGTGKRLGEVPIGGVLADGTVTHTLKRADLYAALYQEARRRGLRVEHGKRLVDAEILASGGVVAHFEDGSEARGDLLIGADGVHARTRRIIDPSAPGPRYTGLGGVGGYAAAGAISLQPGRFRMIFGKHCFFGYTVSPSGEVWWFANPPSPRELTRAELATLDTARWKQRLTELFAPDRTEALEIIQASTGELVGTNLYDLPRVPTWRRGPLVIIGDAAHAAAPSSGQGASMAVEDAVVLARCLRDSGQVAPALEAYERLRRQRVERVVAHGARMSSTKALGPIGRTLRDLLLPLVFRVQARSAGRQSLAWLFNYEIDWAV